MPATPAPVDPGGAAPVRGPRLRAADAGANPSSVQFRDVPDEPAVRLRALRRARRDARTRASRVRRVLLAPTAPAAPTASGEMYTQTSKPRHRN